MPALILKLQQLSSAGARLLRPTLPGYGDAESVNLARLLLIQRKNAHIRMTCGKNAAWIF
jgi:hypothetical protein